MPKRWTDITGQVYSKLLVIHCELKPPNRVWVRCECGKEFAASVSLIISGRRTSCGAQLCSTRIVSGDLTGQTFGFLTVKSFSGKKNSRGELIWECVCQCGNTHYAKSAHLLGKKGECVKSCGCKSSVLRSNRLTKPLREIFLKGKYKIYRDAARKGGREFELTREDFERLVFSRCHYCGSEPLAVHTRQLVERFDEIKWNGIDRVDSSKGYTITNVVTCCKICNVAKSDLTLEEFVAWATRLGTNIKKPQMSNSSNTEITERSS